MKKLLLIITLSLFLQYCFAQLHPDFIIKHLVKTTPVKNQYRSGTCWSFASMSFIETEMLREGKDSVEIVATIMAHHHQKQKFRPVKP